jgi:uncharacterized protein (DUF1697 family)
MGSGGGRTVDGGAAGSGAAGLTIYVALLRGINVSGQRLIKMGDLKRVCESLGLQRVQTYIQSGNVLFESAEAEVPLRRRIEQEIEAVFGFSVPVVLRTAGELMQILAGCPWAAGDRYVTLLAEVPSQAGIGRLLAYRSEVDEYHRAPRRPWPRGAPFYLVDLHKLIRSTVNLLADLFRHIHWSEWSYFQIQSKELTPR